MKKFIIFVLSVIIFISAIFIGCNKNVDNPSVSGNSSGITNNSNSNTDGTKTAKTVKNVVCLDFVLSNGFIEPIEQLATVPDGYIGVTTAEEFDKIRLNSLGKYILMNEIDLSTISEWEKISSFEGILDGNGYIVKNATDTLFKEVKNGEIKNLGVNSQLTLSDKNYAAGIVVKMESSIIDNCFYSGDFSTEYDKYLDTTGGISATSRNSTIGNCYNLANINVDRKKCAGGIVGAVAETNIDNCYNSGNINSSYGYIGGIVGQTESKSSYSTSDPMIINNCYNAGNISINATAAVLVSGFYSSSIISGIAARAIDTKLTVNNCYNRGNLEITTSEDYKPGRGALGGETYPNLCAAGIFGTTYTQFKASSKDDVTITNCYNLGNIIISANEKFEYNSTFGIAGGAPNISYCYNFGEISGIKTGGIASYEEIKYCYFLDNVANATPDGALFANVKKLTGSQMKDKSSFEGFDFDTVWEMGGSDYPYPVFKAQSE